MRQQARPGPLPGMVAVPQPTLRAEAVRRIARAARTCASKRSSSLCVGCRRGPHRRRRRRPASSSGRFADVLAFRDYLRTHPDAVRQYEELKRQLAIRYADDRNAYTDGKTAMVGLCASNMTYVAAAEVWVWIGSAV